MFSWLTLRTLMSFGFRSFLTEAYKMWSIINNAARNIDLQPILNIFICNLLKYMYNFVYI